MENAFPLIQSVGLLRDVLRRAPVAFLLGAGCPASIDVLGKPLIPTIRDLTSTIFDRLRADDAALLDLLIERLKTRSPGEPNIEVFLSYLRTLASVVQSNDIEGIEPDALRRMEVSTCQSIVDLAKLALPAKGTPYHQLAAWAQAASGQMQVEFFTTNYDLLLEQALELLLVPYFDGFVGSTEAFFDLAAIENDVLPPRWAKLWKLHGSINWYEQNGRAFRSNLQEKSNLLIYPSHLKYDESRRLPYVAMADRLLAFLRQDKAILISCGFSFADQHLNDLIGSGLRANGSASLFALMFERYDAAQPIAEFAKSHASVSAYFPDRAIIGGLEGSWNEFSIAREAPAWSLMKWEGDSVLFSGGDFNVFAEFLGQMANYKRFEPEASTIDVPVSEAEYEPGLIDG